ncbi:MAG: DUF2285 domain-containing protein [Sphingomonas sp.]|nr:DUF2285 domain-containing protein [Sphingomonas sp.]
MFWAASTDPHVVTLCAEPSGDGERDAVDFRQLGISLLVRVAGDRREAALLREGPYGLRLDIEGSILAGPVVPRFTLTGIGSLGPKLLTLQRLRGLLRRGHLPRSLYPRELRARRWAEMFQALDGADAGASHREIATALYGADAVLQSWRGASDYLRLKVQRLLRDGRHMAGCGYRAILWGPDHSAKPPM